LSHPVKPSRERNRAGRDRLLRCSQGSKNGERGCRAAGKSARITPFLFWQGETLMVVIRLARGGAKKRPFYNVVVADSRRARDGRYVERIGYYNPMAAQNEEKLRIAMDRVAYWQGHGAQLSDTVRRLVRQAGESSKQAA
jgi:small subunit ribosomal protein S16